jgi:hypothetical protein
MYSDADIMSSYLRRGQVRSSKEEKNPMCKGDVQEREQHGNNVRKG